MNKTQGFFFFFKSTNCYETEQFYRRNCLYILWQVLKNLLKTKQLSKKKQLSFKILFLHIMYPTYVVANVSS